LPGTGRSCSRHLLGYISWKERGGCAVAYLKELAPSLPKGSIVVINLSGRGDKDVATVAELIKGRADK